MLWLIVFLFVLLVVRLYFTTNEGFFMEEVPMDPETKEKYMKFIKFYNPFMVNWEKAIITSISLRAPAPAPLTSPSQMHDPSNRKPKQPSRTEMNLFIKELSEKEGRPFPPVTDPFPDQTNILPTNLPEDQSVFHNALDWMNQQMVSAQQSLKDSSNESFANCQEVSQCIANDPAAMDSIAAAQQKRQEKQQETQRKKTSAAMDKFITNPSLLYAMKKNVELAMESEETQNKAQSGQLLNEMKFPDNDPISFPMKKPANADKLKKLKQSDPAKYQEYEVNNRSMFSLKQSLDQINGRF
jgi:hypothetical protein